MDDALFPDDLGPMAPTAPQAPAVPGVSSFLPEPNTAQKIAPAVIAALALALGPKRGGGGLAAGFAQGQNRVDQRNLQIAQTDHADAIRQQAMQQQALKQQAAAEQAHQQRLMAAKLTIKQQLAGVRDKAQYDQAIDSYANILMQSGYRVTPNQLRVDVPFVAPSAKQIAGDAVSAWLKNPANAEAVKRDPLVVSKVMLRIDTNGDGIAENVPLLRAGELGGVQFATDANGQVVGSVKADEKIGTQFQELLQAKRARFLAENKREPSPKEQEALVTAALREGSEAQRKPESPLAPGQLPAAVQRRVDVKTRSFDALPVVKSTQKMSEAVAFAQSLDSNTTNPADDQALIYAFAKAMDPDSVVREGEYNTVQKYAQSWAETYGFNAKRIFSNTPFLSAKARSNMKSTILSKFNAARRQYDAVRKSYGDQINRVTGGQDGADYLTDYGAAFPEQPQQKPNPRASAAAKLGIKE